MEAREGADVLRGPSGWAGWEIQHRYGDSVHILDNLYLLTALVTSVALLTFAEAPDTEQFRPWRVEFGPAGNGHYDAPSDEAEERYLLLCDPRGVGGGVKALEIATFADPSEAVTIADRLAHQLHVRFLVALERLKHCTR